MPVIIDGIKFACEPCIRGHRSTKCNHGDSRELVQVRSPGRPLSSCPHTGVCNCNRLVVAFSRAPNCGQCGSNPPVTPLPKGLPGRTDGPALRSFHPDSCSLLSPYDPRSRSEPEIASRKRLGDSSSAQVTKVLKRELQETDPGHSPQPFDSAHACISSQFNSLQAGPDSPHLHLGAYPQPSSTLGTPTSTLNREIYSRHSTPSECSSVLPEHSQISSPGTLPRTPSPWIAAGAEAKEAQLRLGMMGIGGYRASKDEMGWNGDWPRIYSSPPNDKLQSFHPLQPRKDRGGCCTQKSVSRDSSVEATSAASTSIPAPHGALNNPPARSHPSRNESSKRQVTPSAGDTLYKIPSGYGTLKQPLTEEQLGRLRQDGRLLAQTVPVYATDDGILDGEVITASGTDHFCRCGPGCQCRACVAHPYNETTREFVQSMGEVMSADFEQGAGMGDVCSTHKTRPQSSGQPLEIYDMAAPTTQSFNYNRSLEQSREPLHLSASPPFSGLESQSSWSQMESSIPQDAEGISVPSTDYSFFSYPLSGCLTGGCQCGDGCTCVGCLTHSGHDGRKLISESPISPPESQTGLESLQQSHTESDISNINTSGINTYIPINLPQIIAKSRGRDDLVQSNYFANDSLGLDKFHPEYAPIASVYQNTYGTSYH